MGLPTFYPILDTQLCPLDPVIAAKAILDAGAQILQLRNKIHFSRDLFAQAQQIAALCKAAGAQFIINDRADIALLLDAGLHIGQDDLPPQTARRLIGPQRLLGFSTHNESQLQAAQKEPVDYIALGPIFGTASKQNPDPIVGLEELKRLRSYTNQPLVGIGGITQANAREVLKQGADAVAVIAGMIPVNCTPQSLSARIGEWLALTRLERPS